MKRILLTGARAPATLHFARLLQEQGHCIYAADSCLFPITRASNTIEQFFTLPAPVTQPDAFIKRLLELIRMYKIDWLIPTCEEVFHISRSLDLLQIECQVLTDHLEKLTRFHNKWQFSQLIQDADVQMPETKLIDTPDALNRLKNEAKNYVFKPVYSRFASKTLIRPHPDEMTTVKISPQTPWIAQKFIAGTEYSSYSIAHRGKLTLHCAYHSTYRAGRGAGIYFKPFQSQAIESFVARFVQQHDYTGQIAFDFMEDSSSENIFVLECNPRLTSGLHLYSAKDKVASAVLNEPPLKTALIRPKVKVIPMLGSMMWLYGLNQNNMTTFLKDIHQGQDVIWDSKDNQPFFYQPLSLLEMSFRSLQHKCSLLSATTLDIEWNGQ